MNIFVSSRIQELTIERKNIIDTIHFNDHTPIYIETEPLVRDDEARKTMDLLIGKSDALVLIYFLTLGEHFDTLGNQTPIQYEYRKFREIHPKGKCLIICKKPPDRFNIVEPALLGWVEKIKKIQDPAINHLTVESPEAVSSEILKWTQMLPNIFVNVDQNRRIVIRYTGPDCIGLIGAISETLFHKFILNINYISQASRSGLSTVYLSCSGRDDGQTLEKFMKIVKVEVEKAVNSVLKEYNKIPKEKSKDDINIQVDPDIGIEPPYQFYIEMRTIDAPGQLNAVCKILKAKNFNIDELIMKPTEREHKRQTTLCLWLSKDGEKENAIRELWILESLLHRLVGIRSCSTRIINYTSIDREDQQYGEGMHL